MVISLSGKKCSFTERAEDENWRLLGGPRKNEIEIQTKQLCHQSVK